MASLLKRCLRLIQGREVPRAFPTTGYKILDNTIKFEEENMPAFAKGLYYPITLGQVFKDRYQILTKLGFGANSTVWLCRDLIQRRYTALKVYINHPSGSREIKVLNHLASLKPCNHRGRDLLRQAQDSFSVESTTGTHACIVHEPLLMNILDLQYTISGLTMTAELLKGLLHEMLTALDYLHTIANTIHTDIQGKNIIIASTDSSIWKKWDEAEFIAPSPRKVLQHTTIYQSRKFDIASHKGWRGYGKPILCDFGEARIGPTHRDLIQPDLFRAPEVILGMEWDSKVDIWNLGALAWGLLEDHHLLSSKEDTGARTDEMLLSRMTAILGPPPMDFIAAADTCTKYWTTDGTWIGSIALPPATPLEDLEEYLEGNDKILFLRLIRKMLAWKAQDRSSAAELLQDEWLNT